MASGCGILIADKGLSFVCHSTPHFDSTSREVSYSVANIIHQVAQKVNT